MSSFGQQRQCRVRLYPVVAMAVFGVQLVISMVVASVLHKIAPYYSLGRWFVTSGLLRYLPPSDKLLRPHLSTPTPANKLSKKKAMGQRDKILSSPNSTTEQLIAAITYDPSLLDQTLAVPKSANLKLATSPLKWTDVEGLHFAGELEFMVNLTFAAMAVFGLTSLYFLVDPGAMATEYNLSVIWLVVVIGYTLKVLLSLTSIYLSEELAHQRSLVIVFTTLFFVCALGVLLVDESFLNFGLERSHQNISKSVSVLLEAFLKEGMGDIELLPMWCFKIFLALLCSVLSMVLTFPGFRFADTHFNIVYHTKPSLFKTLIHANYIAPMCCLSLWIRPLTQDMIAEKSSVSLLGVLDISYDVFRVWTLLGVCALRVALFRTYLQSYLDTARWRVENLRQEQGRITILQLRKKVSNIFMFYAALGVQYIAPYLILLCLTLLIHTSAPQSHEAPPHVENKVNIFRASGLGINMFQGCLAFICWWVCFTNTVTSGFGVILKEFI